MTIIYTTQRVISVEEDYQTIKNAMIDESQKVLELTEIITLRTDFGGYQKQVLKKEFLLQKNYIIEVAQ